MLAILISAQQHVGVDIQFHATKNKIDGIAKRFFSDEESAFLEGLGSQERKKAFFRFWVIKEAVSKAMGLGMRYPMGHINALRLNESGLLTVCEDCKTHQKSKWSLFFDDIGDDYSLCCTSGSKLKKHHVFWLRNFEMSL